ncbi:polyketide synthase dehydratase domain-containing protein, partial [Salinispora pacifica]|uniref:polyketide synthase dehydratase domain-containing protein n=1 Tax=Salinispora pacifica TaxID=351187 RepID=UPI001EE2DDC4
MELIEQRLLEVLAGVAPRSSSVPFYSTVTGGVVDTVGLDAGYWFANLRRRVRFEEATRVLLGAGMRVFLECSAHPVLTVGIEETAADVGVEVAAVGSLRRGEGGWRRWLVSVGEAFVRGVGVDWSSALPVRPRGEVLLPTYPFQRRRYWINATGGVADLGLAGLGSAGHPLWGAAVTMAESGEVLFTGRLSLDAHPWLADHAVSGRVLLPGAGFVELVLHAGDHVGCGRVEELTLHAPLFLPEQGAVQVQLLLGVADDAGRRPVSVHARSEHADPDLPWTRHAAGILSAEVIDPGFDLTVWPPLGAVPVSTAGLYDDLVAQGYEYGPVFQGVQAAWRVGEVVYAEVALPQEAFVEAGRFGVHPALLDAALQAVGIGEPVPADRGPYLPFAWADVALFATGATALRVKITSAGPEAATLHLADPEGSPVAVVG